MSRPAALVTPSRGEFRFVFPRLLASVTATLFLIAGTGFFSEIPRVQTLGLGKASGLELVATT